MDPEGARISIARETCRYSALSRLLYSLWPPAPPVHLQTEGPTGIAPDSAIEVWNPRPSMIIMEVSEAAERLETTGIDVGIELNSDSVIDESKDAKLLYAPRGPSYF